MIEELQTFPTIMSVLSSTTGSAENRELKVSSIYLDVYVEEDAEGKRVVRNAHQPTTQAIDTYSKTTSVLNTTPQFVRFCSSMGVDFGNYVIYDMTNNVISHISNDEVEFLKTL